MVAGGHGQRSLGSIHRTLSPCAAALQLNFHPSAVWATNLEAPNPRIVRDDRLKALHAWSSKTTTLSAKYRTHGIGGTFRD